MTLVRALGIQEYMPVWKAMQQFTRVRDATTQDEIWYLEHPPVYTQGQAGKAEHLLCSGDIPVIQSDRGGQITYHGPGQLVVYFLLDIQRSKIGVRTLVSMLESSLIQLLSQYSIKAITQCGAPGVYVLDKKIASIGLRVKNGKTYHGIALNVAMDLSPFAGINPCGFKALKMVNMSDFIHNITVDDISTPFIQAFLKNFGQEALWMP